MSQAARVAKPGSSSMKRMRYLKEYVPLWVMAAPALILLILFAYVPMAGMVIVFKDYNFLKGI